MPKPSNPTPSSHAPSSYAQAVHAYRTKRQHKRAMHDLAQLQTERHSLVQTLKDLTANHADLLQTLERVGAANERGPRPGESGRLRAEIERAEWRVRECHRRWDELGEQIEEKHGEIAFGGSDDDQGRGEG